MTHPEAQEFTKRVLNHMRERLSDYQESTATCTTSKRPRRIDDLPLCKHDKEQFPDIITANETAPPTTRTARTCPSATPRTCSTRWTSRTICRLCTRRVRYSTPSSAKNCPTGRRRLPRQEDRGQLQLPYYTLSPTYSICKDHGYLAGEQYVCLHCGQKTEVYSRITGYYRPVQNWNDGKAQEFKDRKVYDINHSTLKGHKHAEETAAQTCCASPALDGPVLFTGTDAPTARPAN